MVIATLITISLPFSGEFGRVCGNEALYYHLHYHGASFLAVDVVVAVAD